MPRLRRARPIGDSLVGRRAGTGAIMVLMLWGCQGGSAPDRDPKLTLTWAPSAGAAEYVIERAEGETFKEIARVPAPQTQYVDRTVRIGVRYCYQIRAQNPQGSSAPSPRQCGTPKP